MDGGKCWCCTEVCMCVRMCVCVIATVDHRRDGTEKEVKKTGILLKKGTAAEKN